jgi:predicted nucleic acid-binding Zn ribbon protein
MEKITFYDIDLAVENDEYLWRYCCPECGMYNDMYWHPTDKEIVTCESCDTNIMFKKNKKNT